MGCRCEEEEVVVNVVLVDDVVVDVDMEMEGVKRRMWILWWWMWIQKWKT